LGAISDRYEYVRNQAADAADCVGRAPADVKIVAVTKNVEVQQIRLAMNAGLRDFGENRVQEFIAKHSLFPDLQWHFIGTLQTNKVKHVVGRAYLIHSVDSHRLLEAIGNRAREHGVRQEVLLQVNVSGEDTKHGFSPRQTEEALVAASEMESVCVKGLMTMAPFGRPEDSRWVFADLRNLRDTLCAMQLNGVELEELSMGMTNDYRIAIEEGSTIVRIGRAIFGR